MYETEDPGGMTGAGFYRFVPDDPEHLTAGGTLDMLKIKGHPNADLRENQEPGVPLTVRWVGIEDPDPTLPNIAGPGSTFNQGWAKGGAKFFRLEGCWADGSTIYFVSTGGGDEKHSPLSRTASGGATARSGPTAPATATTMTGRSR